MLEMQVVTGTGELVRLGRRTAKGVAGSDLAGLMVGSEGTLGVVTEVTVRLRSRPAPSITVVGFFNSVVTAGEAVKAVADAQLTPSALALLDQTCLEAVDAWKNMGLSTESGALLLARVNDPAPTSEAIADAMVGCIRGAGASWSDRSADEQEGEVMFAARRLAYSAVERLGSVLTEDVCVPKGNIAEMLERIERIERIERTSERHGILVANFAHAGDGNLHPLLVTPPGDEAARVRAQLAFDDIIVDALELGGTITGEHGVGLIKRSALERELGTAVIAMHHAIKDTWDPMDILNPGKVVRDKLAE